MRTLVPGPAMRAMTYIDRGSQFLSNEDIVEISFHHPTNKADIDVKCSEEFFTSAIGTGRWLDDLTWTANLTFPENHVAKFNLASISCKIASPVFLRRKGGESSAWSDSPFFIEGSWNSQLSEGFVLSAKESHHSHPGKEVVIPFKAISSYDDMALIKIETVGNCQATMAGFPYSRASVYSAIHPASWISSRINHGIAVRSIGSCQLDVSISKVAGETMAATSVFITSLHPPCPPSISIPENLVISPTAKPFPLEGGGGGQ